MAAPRVRTRHSAPASSSTRRAEVNKLRLEDRAVHDWYRFVLSYPPHLVRDYLHAFKLEGSPLVLDPFCGTGTTLVECKKLGIDSIGVEANPVARFASSIKVDWSVDSNNLLQHARRVAQRASRVLESQGLGEYEHDSLPLFNRVAARNGTLRTLTADQMKLLLKNSISPIPLHKTLILRDMINGCKRSPFTEHERLALAKTIVFAASNLHFGPEVGVGPAKMDAPVVSHWLAAVAAMAADIRDLSGARARSCVYQGDARDIATLLEPHSIDAIITSPPYPNEKDYTRTTRLESVILGFFGDMHELRAFKKTLVRSNTRSVYKEDDDHQHIANHPEITRIAHEIEARRVALGKTSGWERQYSRVTRLYFGGMARHLSELRIVLKPGARLAYVVGDQASYLRVMIRTGEILASIAASLGYEVTGMDLFRTRLATATKEQLREEVVLLRWSG